MNMDKINIKYIQESTPDVAQKYADKFVADEVLGALKIAEIRITVGNFEDVMKARLTGANPCTGFHMKMTEDHKSVSLDPETADFNKLQALHVKQGGATIRFVIVDETEIVKGEIVDKADNEYVYQALSIAFVLKNTNIRNLTGDKQIGSLNFDQKDIRPVGNSLYITDKYKDAESKLDYEFSIIIQHKASGAIGIIDPPIIHDPR